MARRLLPSAAVGDAKVKQIGAGLLVGAGFLLLYWRVIASLVRAWSTDDNYSHGFVIVPIALYFAWERRDRFAAAPIRPSLFGLVVVLGSMCLLMAGLLGAELFITRLSLLGTATGIILFLFGWRRLSVLIFPLAFLLLMIPLPAILFNQIAFPLQLTASRVGEFVITAANVPVLREGNLLVLPNTTLEVAEACSGIRSLVSLLTLGITFGYFADSRAWVRTLIALSTIPVAILSNGLRVAGTGIAAHRFGPAAAEGFFHEFSGWALFVVAFLMMLGLQRLLLRALPPPRPAVAVAPAR
jgi:exosortase